MLRRLLDLLFPLRTDEAIVQELKLEVAVSLLAPTLVQETSPETIGLLPFSDTRVRAMIHEAKYHGNERALTFLGTVLGDYVRDADHTFTHALLVPVPLGQKRRRARGHNQVESVVTMVAKEQKIPVGNTLLVRTRETISQVSLPRDKRLENMHGAFAVTHGERISPTTLYIVVDDVVTTGATLQAAIDALTLRGAKHILPIALAH